MYKLIVEFEGFLCIAEYSSNFENLNIVVPRIEDPFSKLKYVSIFRGQEYQPFHIESASQELTESGVYFILYWVQINNGRLVQWHLSQDGKYVGQEIITRENVIKNLYSHLIFYKFPGYFHILKKLHKDNSISKSAKNNSLIKILFCLNSAEQKSSKYKTVNSVFPLVEYFLDNPNLGSEVLYISLRNYINVVNTMKESGLNENFKKYIGDFKIYQEILTKGDLVYFENSNDVPDIWNQVEDLLKYENGRNLFYTEMKLTSLQSNIKYSVIRYLTGFSWCKCPFTGNILKSNKSILLEVSSSSIYIGYYFESIYPFFLLSYGGWTSNNYAIYIPLANICIILHHKNQWGDNLVIQKLLDIFNEKTNLIRSYLENETKHKCLLIDCKDNLGHYLWQDLSGLSMIFDQTNLSQYLECYLVKPGTRYNENCFAPEYIFPELKKFNRINDFGNKHNQEPDSQPALIDIALKENLFLSKLEDIIMSKFLRPRIDQVINQSQQNVNILEFLNLKKQQGAKILFINLRTHNKVWVNAVEVISRFLNEIDTQIVAVYDGFKDIKPLIKEIEQNVSNPLVSNLDCTELKLNETCAVVKMIDVFLCVIGSGLVLPTWMYEKPGVAHGDQMHLAQKTLWKYVTPKMQNLDKIIFLEESEIDFIENKFYGNYRIDYNVISQKLKNLLEL